MAPGKYVPPHKRYNNHRHNNDDRRSPDDLFREKSYVAERLAQIDKLSLTRLPIELPSLPPFKISEDSNEEYPSYASILKNSKNVETEIAHESEDIKPSKPHIKKLIQYDRSSINVELDRRDMAAIEALSNFHRQKNYENWKDHYAYVMEGWYYEHKDLLEVYQISYDNFCQSIYRGTDNTFNQRTQKLEKLLV